MIIRNISRALAVSLLASAGAHAAAQEEASTPTTKAPTVAVYTPPADPLADLIVKSIEIDWRGSSAKVELLVEGESAALRIFMPEFDRPGYYMVDQPSAALNILLDRRLEELWEPLADWAGKDLGKLKQYSIKKAQSAWISGVDARRDKSTAESTLTNETKLLFQYARALGRVGQDEKAIALLLNAYKKNSNQRRYGGYEAAMLSLRAAQQMRIAGNIDDAIIFLKKVQENKRIKKKWMVNIDVNLAAFLAENGDYQEALAVINLALTDFGDKKGGNAIPGSNRQFSWIKACALHGLGKAKEAKAIMDNVNRAPENYTDPDFYVEPTSYVTFRARNCIGDKSEIVASTKNLYEQDTVITGLFADLQYDPEHRPSYALYLSTIQSSAEIRSLVKDRMRKAPPELQSALKHWRRVPDRLPE